MSILTRQASACFDDTIEERIREGRPLPKEVKPGTVFEIVPSPELAPAAPFEDSR